MTAVRALLLLGEYVVTSCLRSARRGVPAAVYVFDDGVDIVVHGGQVAARAVGAAVRWR